ncbi:MAG: CHAT domain-containing protein [Actinobacteria bacterium]|nr:CHAT domain-containing protein [Actinomycetota bacterium]
MAFLGRYRRETGTTMPRVVTISVARAASDALKTEQTQHFSVRMHEEGTPVTWRRDIALKGPAQRAIEADLVVLDDWSQGLRSDPKEATRVATRLGRRLYDTFLGASGSDYLAEHEPTALMIDADETALNLPWELMADTEGPLVLKWPVGRIVTTRTRPRPERDPRDEDTTIAVLAVVDPSRDLSDVDSELAALRRLGEMGYLRLDVLEGDAATHASLAGHVAATAYDVLHFSGHGGFLPGRPGLSGLQLADGPLLTRSIVDLPWQKPPYLAITSACWSARSAPDRRLATPRGGGNGVAAAFLSAGASGCLGFGWPVTVRAAALFVETFYGALVDQENVGRAVLEARRATMQELWGRADLAGLGAVFYGDVGTAERRELQQAE